jgi:hypothetical protein
MESDLHRVGLGATAERGRAPGNRVSETPTGRISGTVGTNPPQSSEARSL